LLAKLEKSGFVHVIGRDWSSSAIYDLAGLGNRSGGGKDVVMSFARAAQAAYERERSRVDEYRPGEHLNGEVAAASDSEEMA
jgi:hypothetical protein